MKPTDLPLTTTENFAKKIYFLYNIFMRAILRIILINFVALWATSQILPGLSYTGGLQTLFLGSLAFAALNIFLTPVLKLLLLPLNLMTVGIFSWVSNVLALFVLVNLLPQFKLVSYYFPGLRFEGFIVPGANLPVLWVAIIASFLIGVITHFLHWLSH